MREGLKKRSGRGRYQRREENIKARETQREKEWRLLTGSGTSKENSGLLSHLPPRQSPPG